MEFYTAKQCFTKVKNIKVTTLNRVATGLIIINVMVFALLVWTMINSD